MKQLLILRASAFPPIPRERGKRVWEELSLAQFRGGTTLRQTLLPQKVRIFQAQEKRLQGKVSWALVRFGIQRSTPCMLQGHLGLGSSVTAEGHSSHCHQPLRADFN